jgi:hypothetical protein
MYAVAREPKRSEMVELSRLAIFIKISCISSEIEIVIHLRFGSVLDGSTLMIAPFRFNPCYDANHQTTKNSFKGCCGEGRNTLPHLAPYALV